MPLFRSESIVLRSYPISEADKIIVFLTRDHGVIRGVAKGAKRLKSRFGSALESFSIVNIEYFQKENSELASIQSAEIAESHFLAAAMPDFLAAFSHIAELVIAFSPPHDPNEKLYRMLKACLDARPDSPSRLFAISVYCKVWLLRLGGYLPDWTRCSKCGSEISPEEPANISGGWHLMCQQCFRRGADRPISKEVREAYFQIQRLSPSEFVCSTSVEESTLVELSGLLEKLIASALGVERAPAMRF